MRLDKIIKGIKDFSPDLLIIISPLFIFCLTAPQKWLFTEVGPLDPWMFLRKFIFYTSGFINDYKDCRLPWIIPGHISYSLFGPLTGHYVILLLLLCGTTICVYFLMRNLFNRNVAIISSVFISCYPFAHGSGGWLYHNTPLLFYYCLGFLAITLATTNRNRTCWLFVSGAAFVSALHLDPFFIFPVIFAVGHYIILHKIRLKTYPSVISFIWIGIGSVGITAIYSIVNYVYGGLFLFFIPQLNYIIYLSKGNVWYPSDNSWILTANHLAFPILFSILGLVILIYYIKNIKKIQNQKTIIAISIILQFLILFGILAYFTFVWKQTVLTHDYPAFRIIGPMLIAIGSILYLTIKNIKTYGGYFLPLCTIIIFTIPMVFLTGPFISSIQGAFSDIFPKISWLLPVLIGFASFAGFYLIKGKTWAIIILLIGLSLANCLLIAPFSNNYYWNQKCAVNKDFHVVFSETTEYMMNIDPSREALYWTDINDNLPICADCSAIPTPPIVDSLVSAVDSHWYGHYLSDTGAQPTQNIENISGDIITKLKTDQKIVIISSIQNNSINQQRIIAKYAKHGISLKITAEKRINYGKIAYNLSVLKAG
ncbi:glycosyltransferase family 39 protein [Methanoregula formicica]|uniref:Glycosyltransferase RgtA/B/C/D-like domain-containing protein n=1 Tax=Methanoregula formicica (strain DSM 22288 / NBRC 105244 / SMSP) TaxID=593750 RepID=L0HEH5_METFS|nr:glycosyltransferase family 39 protein [Methanoregula formicica]AGB01509.1 hypothetical protein Metfor_0437 [Methanoregula formicica SMSP]